MKKSDIRIIFSFILLWVIMVIVFSIYTYAQQRYELKTEAKLLVKSQVIALNFEGLKELTGHNDGYWINRFNRTAGVPFGSPYCMSGQYFCYDSASRITGIKIPFPKSGVANSVYSYAKKKGNKTSYNPQVSDFITWKKIKSFRGHIERVFKVGKKGWVWTIAFNTSNGKRGSQREGNGVYFRKRNIYHPLGRMLIRGLVGFKTNSKFINYKEACNYE